ncbi:MAG TPA: S41 family peptidase, partial [Candidatus Paceibacterota bacterium]
QEVIKVTDNTLLKITVAKWLTPNGASISEKGLTPDYKVGITKEDTAAKVDPQMNKAVELLKNWPGVK